MTEDSLFDSLVEHPAVKPPKGQRQTHRVLITVKAAPNPSTTYGETVCVAGIRLADAGPAGWIRLYPINFRHLPTDSAKFHKYDVVTVECRPAENDSRIESWKPNIDSLTVQSQAKGWPKRRPLVDPLITGSMCRLRKDAIESATAPSLGLVRPADVSDLRIERHPGWTMGERAKIDQYVGQFDLLDDTDKTPLEAPRFIGTYRWRCQDPKCGGHNQMTLDWEFTALQRHLRHETEAAAIDKIRSKFLDEICGADRDVAFYVGNQAKRHQTWSILGAYWPPKG